IKLQGKKGMKAKKFLLNLIIQ
ncbi:MAG: hypothetical protein H6Q21_2670, partial [Bacteroidetes bacterium]|nr:hypothetical protein [Bacteroidota bacterium]